MTFIDPFDPINPLPFDSDSFDPHAPQKPRPTVLGDAPFAYIGTPLTVEQFTTYLESYDFGPIPPDYIVLHHTANPDASYAPLSADPRTKWDRNEQGLSAAQIRAKRTAQLDGIMRYYRDTEQWNAGPHLFIDELYIWLFTPLADIGIHAKWGNSFRSALKLHYGVGIEVIGFYGKVVWPPAVAANVRGAVKALRDRLATFELRYLYPNPSDKPGMIGMGNVQKCAHPDRLRAGGISSHRDYNKPECPGAAISEAFYMNVLTQLTPTPNSQLPVTASYRVRAAVTAGATVRSDARQSAPAVDHLMAGQVWQGEEVVGQSVSLEGFGTSDIWICQGGRCVWSGLLQKV